MNTIIVCAVVVVIADQGESHPCNGVVDCMADGLGNVCDLPAEPPFLRDPSLLPTPASSIAGLRVYSAGEMLVLGFGGNELPDSAGGLCREQVLDLIDLHHARKVAFDLTQVGTITASVVRVLASARCRCAVVQLFNASDEVREQLRKANLAQFFELIVEDFGQGELPGPNGQSEGLQETREWTI